jgi:hypothetical protein
MSNPILVPWFCVYVASAFALCASADSCPAKFAQRTQTGRSQ